MNRIVLMFAACALARPIWAQTPAQTIDGNALVQQICTQCHMGGVNRAPDMDTLRAMSADRVLAALETGPMISMITGRSAAERRAIAEAITGKQLRNTIEITPLPKAMCSAANPVSATAKFNASAGPA